MHCLLEARVTVEEVRVLRPLGQCPFHGDRGALGQVHIACAQALLQPPEGAQADAVKFLVTAELQGEVFDLDALEVMSGRDDVIRG